MMATMALDGGNVDMRQGMKEDREGSFGGGSVLGGVEKPFSGYLVCFC
jgi:hypothetical protein